MHHALELIKSQKNYSHCPGNFVPHSVSDIAQTSGFTRTSLLIISLAMESHRTSHLKHGIKNTDGFECKRLQRQKHCRDDFLKLIYLALLMLFPSIATSEASNIIIFLVFLRNHSNFVKESIGQAKQSDR